MERTIEYREGRISAFAEIKELLSYVITSDKYTASQLQTLTEHIEKQIKLNEQHINDSLELMEVSALLRR